MIDNYDDATVDETLEAVSDWSDEDKAEFVEFERENKNRTGVIEPLTDDLDVDVEAIGDASGDDGEDGPETVEVTVDEYGYAAGLWFDSADETKTVERTLRIDRAIEDGELEVVE